MEEVAVRTRNAMTYSILSTATTILASVTSAMASPGAFGRAAPSGVQVLLASIGSLVESSKCPLGQSELSCHNTTAVQNLCCFNAPGGQMLLTQFWDTKPVTGPVDSWTLHGLWCVLSRRRGAGGH